MPQISVRFFLNTSRTACYRIIDWKKGLELLNEKALKSLEFSRTTGAEPLVITSAQEGMF